MGFFSKLTADTNESIPSSAVAQHKPVYLIQPNGKPPVREDSYEGFGVIGGVNWFVWLAKENAEKLNLDLDALSDDDLFHIGIGIDCGYVKKDRKTDEYWVIFHRHEQAMGSVDVNVFRGTYSDVIPELGASANELVESGRFISVPIAEVTPDLFSIKLSHNPDAIYEDLPASKDCPFQGFFYPDEMVLFENFTVDEKYL
ncbi:hypothetical protein [Aliidiomarina quisquiliarum]|uniref:hypothetical protein n=1 Tax=Aliidiomarina quisquiliarum TaxID=2938947 RepID=UPI00208EEB5F|nr:hypothetical protein [Aliidiomarina quisquiliarum]MCO4319975.1 hypothetical protein [Aliidiomarina quisquiliarum]